LHARHQPLAGYGRARCRRLHDRWRVAPARAGHDADHRAGPVHCPRQRGSCPIPGHRHSRRGRCLHYRGRARSADRRGAEGSRSDRSLDAGGPRLPSQQPDFDLAVVGGGLARASLACAVADTGLSVALVEAVAFDADPDAAMQARTTAIAWGTRVMFEQLGLWAAMAPGGAAIERLHVSQRGHFGVVRVQAADYDLPALGYVLSHTAMVAALRARLAQFQHVTVIAPARFVALEHAGQCVHLQLESDGGSRRISTRLVVGADGANSSVRQALGIGARIDDYAQSALVTTLRTEYAHDNVAYERFTPDGPVAILPRSHDSCAAVWTLPTAQAEAVCAASENEFNRRLQQAFGHRLGRLQLAGPRGTFPLQRVL